MGGKSVAIAKKKKTEKQQQQPKKRRKKFKKKGERETEKKKNLPKSGISVPISPTMVESLPLPRRPAGTIVFAAMMVPMSAPPPTSSPPPLVLLSPLLLLLPPGQRPKVATAAVARETRSNMTTEGGLALVIKG